MHMEEKTMVADTLAGINGELMRFGEMIPQTENKELKQTLKQIRNACEQSQEELYHRPGKILLRSRFQGNATGSGACKVTVHRIGTLVQRTHS